MTSAPAPAPTSTITPCSKLPASSCVMRPSLRNAGWELKGPHLICGFDPVEGAGTPAAILLRNATPSVLDQRHVGRVLRSSWYPRGRRIASSRGRKPQAGRCPSFWQGDLRNDGISVAAAGADGRET